MKKNKILIIIQQEVSFSYDTIKKIYDITNSYDAILELNDLALRYGKNIMELTHFLYGEK